MNNRYGPIITVVLTSILSGCEPLPADEVQVHRDLGFSDMETRTGDVSMVQWADQDSDAPAVDMAVAVEVPDCAIDADCGDASYCDAEGRCQPPADGLFFRPMVDGLSRIGAASFSIVPEDFEGWTDRASAECPDNRRGYFDGYSDEPTADDECQDAFTDSNDNGWFDALWLGGPDMDRPAQTVDESNPPSGRAVLLSRDDLHVVLLTLDVYAIDRAHVESLTRRLEQRLGFDAKNIIIHSTGVRSAPDLVGLSGPSRKVGTRDELAAFRARTRDRIAFLHELPSRSGIDEQWVQSLVGRCEAAIRRAADALAPVQVRQATVELPLVTSDEMGMARAAHEPDADGDGVENDGDDLNQWRDAPRFLAREAALPGSLDPRLHVLSFDLAEVGTPYVVFFGWGAAAGFEATSGRLSADYVGRVRQRVESQWPGSTAIWLTSAASDTFIADQRVHIPEVDLDGHMVGFDGERVALPGESAPAQNPQEALAHFLSRRGALALEYAAVGVPRFRMAGQSVWIPIQNPLFVTAASLGIMPSLHDWLISGVPTSSWVNDRQASACGGHGCLRYGVYALSIHEEFKFTFVPGAFDQGLVYGRRALGIHYGDGRNLEDLDGDGILDRVDEDIRVRTRIGDRRHERVVSRSLNPQQFDAFPPLVDETTWMIGRTNGGLGSFRSRADAVPVFEGALNQTIEFVEEADNGALRFCSMGYPCSTELTVQRWLDRLIEADPMTFADIGVAHELWCMDALPMAESPQRWRLTTNDRRLLAEGDDMLLGPDNRVFSLSTDFSHLTFNEPTILWFPDLSDEGWSVGGPIRAELQWHPNAVDARRSVALGGAGDYIYNTVCTLLASDGCVRREVGESDPNSQLPRDL